jgi:mycofactocin precursor
MYGKNDGVLAATPYPAPAEEPAILEEIEVEDLAVDGICGVY